MAAKPVNVVAAACDGACSGNPGPGGWGALLRFADGSVHEMGGAHPATTNNRMELTAALALLEALKALPRDPRLTIRTDSRYLIDGFGKWIQGWKRKGWRTASGGAVLNRDLWEQLDQARLPGVELVHVKGHSGDPDNDRCDAIAVAFSRGQMPAMAAGEVLTTARIEADVPPPGLQQLLTRLELAERFAAQGYGLSLVELAQLVEQPLQQLERRSSPWRWRDWQVLPLGGGRWRLQRDAGGLGDRE
ncbi:ribonuclease HI [Cyanobium sp. Alchichica 3B3-8F6]|uniref:ribonuclease H family protein n=1 Tax=Cyanobium sp. Alchichica 3B3-8F6 TaxID=2823696 RepID=UPI0020CE6639|nr:ribonuclease H [Cyanobium sp. Alchichica 3B3-8F6]MCP9882235.1 ribonuclease HI [Cyanobium sp. Alchichica 3B3-8F6]